ncbi:MAG: hybrid sensor histidine kinase/response regulator [Zetaproteobacteria bacterium CG1_02_49_23]|nr:MAG: hybrid sensor histidine kinase/response regulator [Zetaproteobacteria bacterium CG1_02_49_23]
MEALGTLVGGIAHDFNNKLAAMIGNLFLAQSEIDASSNAAKRLKAVEKLSFEASNMIKQLLTFARKGNVQQEPLILQSFIKETTKLNRVAIPENIRLSISCCNNPLQIQGDITQLQQIFLNLLTNARDALEGVNNAHIEITLDLYEPDADFYGRHPQLEKKNNTCARIQFRDNGPGISAEIQKLIFDPFFTTKDVGKGTGLGLATVYGAIQAHHGVIEVVSAPGEGTCFRIYLPIYENSSPRAEAKLETDLVAGNRETILFADDDINVLQTSVEMLELIGYRILPAHDGTEALKIYQEHWQTIDLVILDIVMPGMSGGELAKHIRKINAHAKILFATGYDPSQSSNSVEDTSKILLKPFTIKQVSQTIRKMLEA